MGLFDKLFKKDGDTQAATATSTDALGIPVENDAHIVTPVEPPAQLQAGITSTDAAHSPVDLPAEGTDAATSQLAAEPATLADSDEPVDAEFESIAEPTQRMPIQFPSRPSAEEQDAAAQDGPARSSNPGGTLAEMPAPQQPRTVEELRNDPNFVRVFDQNGQEVFLTREQWRDEVLPANLKQNWDNPEQLYAVIVAALNDGYFEQVEEASAHLQQTDTNLVRGACVRAVTLLNLGREPEAEGILDTYLAEHGPDPAVLINLARIYSDRGETDRRDDTLARVLELDPNNEQALAWSLALIEEQAGEQGGEAARKQALEHFAANPACWRAKLWLAKLALDSNELPRALSLYRQGLTSFEGGPVSIEFLYPMSGDLGTAGRLRELLDLTEPHFQPELHGLQVGNNLIKAHADLGELEEANTLVNRLFTFGRPDWRETLGFWDNTLTRMRAAAWQAAHPQDPNQQLEIGMLEMTGPVWKRRGGPLEAVFGTKPENAPLVTILGGTADLTPPQGPNGVPDQQSQQLAMQLADVLGRISRTVPLFLAEQVEFSSAAQARAMFPRVSNGFGGFVLRGGEWSDAEALDFARNAERVPTLIVKSHVDARAQEWVLTATVLRVQDGAKLGTARASFPAGQLEAAAPALSAELRLLLSRNGIPSEAAPNVYQLPEGQALAAYLVRLEQLLAVRTAVASEDGPPPLAGERDILDGVFALAAQLPQNATARALMAQTFVAMARVRPDILDEYEPRLEALERELPIGEPLNGIIREMIL